ncbi:hypothetical protein NLG97_g2680 [Lecanicillium saksenae]|uniref:Uncharacterized protein n=1 Tax=Lecanicillium saksenae TaxID=468837 RepID=A0ACC1R4A1_9HYPO|nr:hypothetical protein NLG97_g2680 [Lecanicillium saksenae]
MLMHDSQPSVAGRSSLLTTHLSPLQLQSPVPLVAALTGDSHYSPSVSLATPTLTTHPPSSSSPALAHHQRHHHTPQGTMGFAEYLETLVSTRKDIAVLDLPHSVQPHLSAPLGRTQAATTLFDELAILEIIAITMIEATCMDHMSSINSLPDPMDLSDSSTTGASPPSDFPELLPFATASSYHINADCGLLLSPVSSVASPPMHQVVKQYALFHDTPLHNLPSPPNSGKMFYPDWNTQFGLEQRPGPNDDVAIPQEFYMQERCTPDPESYLGSYSLADSQSHSVLNQPAPYFVPVPHLGSNGPTLTHDNSVESADSPNTLETASEVSTPGEDSKTDIVSQERVSRKRSISAVPELKKEEDEDSDMQADQDSADETYSGSRRSSSAGLKDNCPDEERCIFLSRWEHRDKKGQDMWDSIQEDYYNEFEKEQCKETLQMKLTRGRSKYIKWLEKDEEILLQAWQNMERNRYKTLLEEFYKLGGSRNMLLNPSDVEVKTVVDLGLEEELYVEGVNEMELRRRCRFLTGKKKTGSRNAEEPGISYSGPSLFGREVDEDEIITQANQAKVQPPKEGGARKALARRRKKNTPKANKGPKKIKIETD